MLVSRIGSGWQALVRQSVCRDAFVGQRKLWSGALVAALRARPPRSMVFATSFSCTTSPHDEGNVLSSGMQREALLGNKDSFSLTPHVFQSTLMAALERKDEATVQLLLAQAHESALLTPDMLGDALSSCVDKGHYGSVAMLVYYAQSIGLHIADHIYLDVLTSLLDLSRPEAIELAEYGIRNGIRISSSNLLRLGRMLQASCAYSKMLELVCEAEPFYPSLALLVRTRGAAHHMQQAHKLSEDNLRIALHRFFKIMSNSEDAQFLGIHGVANITELAVATSNGHVLKDVIEPDLSSLERPLAERLDCMAVFIKTAARTKDSTVLIQIYELLLTEMSRDSTWTRREALVLAVLKQLWITLHSAAQTTRSRDPSTACPLTHKAMLGMWAKATDYFADCDKPMLVRAFGDVLMAQGAQFPNPALARELIRTLHALDAQVTTKVYHGAIYHCWKCKDGEMAWEILNVAIERGETIAPATWTSALTIFETVRKDDCFVPAMRRMLSHHLPLSEKSLEVILSHFAFRRMYDYAWQIAKRVYVDKSAKIQLQFCRDLAQMVFSRCAGDRTYIQLVVKNRTVSEFVRYGSEIDSLASAVAQRHKVTLQAKFCDTLETLWAERADSAARAKLHTLIRNTFSTKGLRPLFSEDAYVPLLHDLQKVGLFVAHELAIIDGDLRACFDLLYIIGSVGHESGL